MQQVIILFLLFCVGVLVGMALSEGVLFWAKKMIDDAQNMLSRAEYAWKMSKELDEQSVDHLNRAAKHIKDAEVHLQEARKVGPKSNGKFLLFAEYGGYYFQAYETNDGHNYVIYFGDIFLGMIDKPSMPECECVIEKRDDEKMVIKIMRGDSVLIYKEYSGAL